MEGIFVMQKRSACGGGSVASWWELTLYERVTPIGVLAGPTKIAARKRKSEMRKVVEGMGFQVVEIIGKDRFRLGYVEV